MREIIKIHQLKEVYDFHERALPDDLMCLFRISFEHQCTNVHSTNQVLNSTLNNLIHIPNQYHLQVFQIFRQFFFFFCKIIILMIIINCTKNAIKTREISKLEHPEKGSPYSKILIILYICTNITYNLELYSSS